MVGWTGALTSIRMRNFHLFLALVLASCALADTPVAIGPPPNWIAVSATPSLTPTPGNQTSYGYDYLLLDRQVNVLTQSIYTHTVYRITADSSLQSGARINWSYDPVYEKFSINHLRVIREGVIQDRLRPDVAKTIQQERDLDRHMLNGQLTTLVLLDDIRVGDVIDYAVTFQGWNPAFAGRFFDSFYTAWPIPVRHQRIRLLVPADRNISYQAVGAVPLALTTTAENGAKSPTWEGRNLEPVAAEKEIPAWFDTYSYLRFTEVSGWADVVKWAEPLYALPVRTEEAISAKAAGLTSGLSTANDKTVALLRFVQQDVRYLGMELGAGCYKPTPPADVLAQRFGDCKGKTILFCSLMRAVGLTAYPALLNTEYRDKIDSWLPSPQSFDHVIAAIPKAEGGYWWVDPTRTNQQGDLGWRALPDYRRALVVKPGETALTRIELPPEAVRAVHIEETFDIAAFDQPARLRVLTRYTGTSADFTRRYFAENTPDQITKDYVNYYASVYPGTTVSTPATLTEDARHNSVTVSETYRVPDLWKKKEDKSGLKAFFYPKTISDYAARPDTPVRTIPLALDYPVAVSLETTVHLPELWRVPATHNVIETEAFRAVESISGEGKTVIMSYAWQSLADHVPVARVTDHVEKINRFRDSLGYSLTYSDVASAPVAASAFRLNWMLTFVAATSLAVMVFAAVRLYYYRFTTPPSLDAGPQLRGLRGWLIVVGLSVTIRPLILLFQIVPSTKPSFNQDVWELMTVPGNASYQSALGPIIIFETIGNILLIVTSLLLVALYYRKKRMFPIMAIAYFLLSVAFNSLDTWFAGHVITAAPADIKKQTVVTFQMVVAAAIWIPYMLKSRRVKATFLR